MQVWAFGVCGGNRRRLSAGSVVIMALRPSAQWNVIARMLEIKGKIETQIQPVRQNDRRQPPDFHPLPEKCRRKDRSVLAAQLINTLRCMA